MAIKPDNDKKPAPSANLHHPSTGGLALVSDLVEANALIGALLYLTHPALYCQQMRVLERLYCDESSTSHRSVIQELFDVWSTPFTGTAMIVNRETVPHRDTRGGKRLMDIVAAFGNYKNGRFQVPLLGGDFSYNPGTALIFPGYLFRHSASMTEGERICIASFIKPNVGRGCLPSFREVPPPLAKELMELHGWGRPLEDVPDIWGF